MFIVEDIVSYCQHSIQYCHYEQYASRTMQMNSNLSGVVTRVLDGVFRYCPVSIF